MNELKILHLSDKHLPDIRIEKLAYLSHKKGLETYFVGTRCEGFALGKSPFTEVFMVPWNRYARLGWWPNYSAVKKKVKKIIEDVKPDIIHAHEVFSAKITSELGYPFVFDDHERFSLEKKSDVEASNFSEIKWYIWKYESWKWGTWEAEISQKAPVITVSEKIAEGYRELGSKVFVIPNYPSITEVSNIDTLTEKDNVITSVYIGNVGQKYKPYRNMEKTIKFFDEINHKIVILGKYNLNNRKHIKSIGYVPHLTMYKKISKYHIGLLPWDKHWFHEYACPNKPYIYAHSGLVVIVTSSLTGVIKSFNGNCRTIDSTSDLLDQLNELSQDREGIATEGERTREFARENLIIELYENELSDAYKLALEAGGT